MSSQQGKLFDIGAVSRLTGLSTPNLRMWEKRHRVVEPSRSESNRRRYTEEDVRRLTLVKTLADHGHSIGVLAEWTTAELEERLRTEADLAGGARGGACRAVVVGDELIGLFAGRTRSLDGIEVLASYATISEAEHQLEASAELLLVATPTLFPETMVTIRRLMAKSGALRAVVAYRFAPSNATRAVDPHLEGITAIRFPIDLAELEVICRAEASLIGSAPGRRQMEGPSSKTEPSLESGAPVPRRFDDQQLARIARAGGAIECECPRHLAELLGALNAFAAYSEDCENRNEEDAEMHAYLHGMTCRARGVIEDALDELIRFEGIELG